MISVIRWLRSEMCFFTKDSAFFMELQYTKTWVINKISSWQVNLTEGFYIQQKSQPGASKVSWNAGIF